MEKKEKRDISRLKEEYGFDGKIITYKNRRRRKNDGKN